MGLESATYISGLNSSNPTASDAKTQGDDHIRLIKSSLLNTVPNLTGAMTRTHTELNNALCSNKWEMSSDVLLNTGRTQPAFSVYRTADQTSGKTLLFSNAHFDIGSCYSSITGRYTASKSGIYLFNVNAMLKNSSGSTNDFAILFYKNGSNADLPYMVSTNVQNNYGTSINISIVVSLTAGEYVDSRSYWDFAANYYLVAPSNFSGYLVC